MERQDEERDEEGTGRGKKGSGRNFGSFSVLSTAGAQLTKTAPGKVSKYKGRAEGLQPAAARAGVRGQGNRRRGGRAGGRKVNGGNATVAGQNPLRWGEATTKRRPSATEDMSGRVRDGT